MPMEPFALATGRVADDVAVESTTSDPTDPIAAKRLKDAPVLATMRQRFKAIVDATSHFRQNAIDDAKFRAGTWGKKSYQWVPGIQEEREQDERPCLTINRAPGTIHQITNQARHAHLRIQVNPVDDRGDPKVAEVFQGIIRNIEVNSMADRAYAMASEKQAEQGLGYFRLVTEWAEPDPRDLQKAFRQRIKIVREKNPLSIFVDASAQDAAFADAAFAFKVTDIDTETYKTRTARKDVPTAADGAFSAEGDETGDWFPDGKVRWIEYFSREPRGARRHVALLSDGRVVPYPTDEDLTALTTHVTIKNSRWIQPVVTVWRHCTAVDIHEETIWPADSPPWIPVIGDELQIEGEIDFRGAIRDSKDTARAYNVQVSGLVEAVGLGQKAPVVGFRGQFGAPNSPQRKAWEEANRKPKAFLELELMEIDGKPAPFIGPVHFDPPIRAIVEAIHQMDEDYKTTSGYHDASLGERGPQESGKAIVARQRQDELGSSHYLDNLRFAMCAAGRQLLTLIRAVYDVPTVIRITGTDGRDRKVMVYSGAERDPRAAQFLKQDPHGASIPFELPEGVQEIYDLSTGEFDIEVSAGPSPGSRRQEATESMTALFQGLPPEFAAKFLDLYFLVMDFPMARQMAERAKKLLPPELQDQDEDGDGAPAIPPQALHAMQAMKEQLGQVMQALQLAQQELKTQGLKVRAEITMKREDSASRERIEALKLKVRLLETDAHIKAEERLLLIQAEIDRLTQLGDQAHDRDLAAIDAGEQHNDRLLEAGLAAIDAASAGAAATPEEGAGDAPAADVGA